VVEPPIERTRGATPLHASERELETLQGERAMPRAATALWPTTRRGVVLWALAALAAIIIGVIPALWINRWRGGGAAQPSRAQEQPQSADVERALAQPAEPAEPAEPAPPAEPAEVAEPAEAAQPTAPAAPEPTLAPAAASPPAKTIKPTRSRPERAKPTPRARKPPPPCDVYRHPKGCPN
jgi:outer membrane biosynthesis protein TonB